MLRKIWFKEERRFRDGEVILPQGFRGEALGVVRAGEVEIFRKTPEGDESIHGILKKDAVFGERSFLEDSPRKTGVRARGVVRCLLLDRRQLIRRMHDDPNFAYLVLKDLSRRIRMLSTNLKTGLHED